MPNSQYENQLNQQSKTNTQLQKNQQQKSNQLRWSEQHKGLNIKIVGMIAEQTKKNVYGQFAVIEPCLSFNNEKTCWGIKINHMTVQIYVGISLISIIKEQSYTFNQIQQVKQHGSYIIGSNGDCKSHFNSNLNANRLFKFDKGDIIYLQFDNVNKLLRFRKNQAGYTFQLKVVDPGTDFYHPTVKLRLTGDSVTLVQGLPLS